MTGDDDTPLDSVDCFVDGNGGRLHYLDWHGDGAPLLLFLHGGGLTAHTWDAICHRLRGQFRCIASDLRGHGDSDWSAEGRYDLDDHTSDVEAIWSSVGAPPVVVIGMSLGGSIALTFVGRHVGSIQGLILVEGGPHPQRVGIDRTRAFRTSIAEVETLEELVAEAERFNPRRSPAQLRRAIERNTRRTPRGTWAWRYDPRAVSQLSGPHGPTRWRDRQVRLWEAVAATTCPVLVVHGTESDMFLAEDGAALAQAFATGGRLEIQGAGHTVQGDRPDELADAIRSFVDGLPGIADGSGGP